MNDEWTMMGTFPYGLPIIHIYGLGRLIIIYLIAKLKNKFIVYFSSQYLRTVRIIIDIASKTGVGYDFLYDYSATK